MARIVKDKFRRQEREHILQNEVLATYDTFMKDDELYFQLDTYKIGAKDTNIQSSCKVQFNKSMAIVLIDTLKKYFSI
jgi:hypothetical protein